jgi:hypothetical protein
MAQNPLLNYFRQPKIYIRLPSGGVYNKIGSTQGDVTNMPVYGMTGMDEIIMKTPDSLMSGESTVRVIESCCPFIKDAWELSAIDTEMILAAIRIATYGNELDVTHTCKHCNHENEYTLDLSMYIEHFNKFKYDNILKLDHLTIRLQPLTYRQGTEFSIKNFELQKQLSQIVNSQGEPDKEQQKLLNELYDKLGKLQTEIFNASIEAVETSTETVTDRGFITEWISNCDKEIFDSIKQKFDVTRKSLKAPPFKAICTNCNSENEVLFELDETNFFVSA